MAKQTDRRNRQVTSVFDICLREKLQMGERLDASRKLFKKKVLAVDLHSHSIHSDGGTTIAENCRAAKERARFDFLFCTDHNTLTQARDVAKCSWAALGQESHSGGYDIGMLLPTEVHEMLDDISEGIVTAKAISQFVWVPHPVGFGNMTEKRLDTAVADLAKIDKPAIEVLNGFNASSRAYPRTGIWGIRLFDRLLCLGKRVTPLGVGDAHSGIEIGNAWTGVFSSKCEAPSIVKALNAGKCFASEAPLLDFTCNGKPMGSAISVEKGAQVRFSLTAADVFGLESARLISSGRVIKEYQLGGDVFFNGKIERKAGARQTYYRFEVTASDGRRGFSAPIYLAP